MQNTTWSTKHNGKYKTQREVRTTAWSTKTQREVQTFDYDNKEVIDLTHYVTCGDLVAVKVEPELSQNTTC